MLPISVPAGFRIIAHRGASAYAPENTRAAFHLADQMGAREVELDAQLTIDGDVVLCHDRSLARYGLGDLVVEQMNWTALAELDMGSWFSPHLYAGERMLRLDDLFGEFGDRFIYHVELKGEAADLAAKVYACMQAHNLLDQCFVTSFNDGSLATMRAIDDTLRLGWLVREVTTDALVRACELALYQLCPQAAQVTAASVDAAREAVTEVRAWGMSGSRQEVIALIHRVVEAGCDGMTIDWPDWFVQG